MAPVTIALVGGGNRGKVYTQYAVEHPSLLQVTAIAEVNSDTRAHLAQLHPAAQMYPGGWEELLLGPGAEKRAAAIVISTQDRMHVAPALAAIELGYHVLLEKPMAVDVDGCKQIAAAAKAKGVIFCVGHVLRYMPYSRALKAMIDDGAVGKVVNVHHLEPVGWFHFAHSYVRGNWASEAEASPVLLAKSCHDIDWLHWIVGQQCTAISSMGSLMHFNKESAPSGAGDRCTDCSVEADCPYSAVKTYMGRVKAGDVGWPTNVITPHPTVETVQQALETGPYGRCVYKCDNDVMDNQVVNMQFANGATVAFTMCAFTQFENRKTSIHGTHGRIEGDGISFTLLDFATQKETTFHPNEEGGKWAVPKDTKIKGGGDYGLIKAFTAAVANDDPSLILSGPDETLQSHLLVFEAEKARKEKRVVTDFDF